VTVDDLGNLFVVDNIRIRKVGTNGVITTVAGNGLSGYSGDGGAATKATLFNPSSVAVDAFGNLFHCGSVRSAHPQGGNQWNYQHNGGQWTPGYFRRRRPAIKAEVFDPSGVAVDHLGNLFIADYQNNRIRKVGTNGIISTVAGNGVQGYSGDGGPATNAALPQPYAVALDAFGNLFIAIIKTSASAR